MEQRCFMKPQEGEPFFFASRIAQDSWVGSRPDRGTWQMGGGKMENKDKEENKTRDAERKTGRHITVSGHSGIRYEAPSTSSVPEPMAVCKHVNFVAGCSLAQASSFFLFAPRPFLIILPAK
jgi:hypothetical protein